jgi:hypothetical protein
MHSGHDIRDDKGHMVAIVHNPAADPAEGARIAALMASAPDLLAALKLCERALEQREIEAEEFAAKNARAAIAKAKGEA